YGEAWYDLDVPILSAGSRYQTTIVGQLSVGYLHSRFDGHGLSVGPAIGYVGSLQLAWRMRFRRINSPLAVQTGLGAWFGNGVGGTLELGIVLPDLGQL